jgi:hypothetical protein
MREQVMEAGMQAGERLSEVAEERGLTAEGLKDAARDVGETFSSALSEEKPSGQAPNAQRSRQGPTGSTQRGPGEERTTQNPQSQGRTQSSQPGSSKAGKPQSTKRSGPGDVSSDAGPNGGRR